MDGRIAFLFEEPLAQILPVARPGPGMVVYVEDFLLLTLLLSRRGRLPSLLSLGRLRLLSHCWLLQMQGLIVTFGVLVAKDSQVTYSADILLDPIEVLAD